METSASFEARSAPLPYPTCSVKRKQGCTRAGYRAAKNSNRDADAVVKAEGSMVRSDTASSGSVLRGRCPVSTWRVW
jgi:hypothetical protein